MFALALALALYIYGNFASAEVLTPPYFNLALGKNITATATCGDELAELYCKLVGANADHDERVIGGQVCDMCDASVESKRHPPEYAVDGMETWWQSPPLSRSMKYNEVNLTIDLGQEFHVAYVFVRMGNSPRPGVWALEKSTDYGKTFKPWQYFSDSPQDCERYFGRESLQPITKDDSVICSTEYSKIVPLEGGEIPISLLNSRPSAKEYFNSSVLQEWTRATNVRLRLLRTKNLLGHLMSVARQDPTVTRRYFYSIKDISIGGRCMCNGHADTCDPADPESNSNILVCRCQHNTCGDQCAQCCPGFKQKKWRISQTWDRFNCEPCNCHNHTTECDYDPEIDEKRLSLDIHNRYEGGGVCKNCQDNTEGINCNKCKPTFYRPPGKRWDEIDVCRSCDCDPHFSTGNCAEESGQCECRKEFTPPLCDSCAYGYYNYPDCVPCECNLNGTDGNHCNPIGGLCPCKFNYAGKSCEVCANGYYSPECKSCECNTVGSVSTECDKGSGNCTCKSKYAGRTCNQCEAGYYNYPSCSHCNCDTSGTLPNICEDVTGQCICKEGFGGARCDQCVSGYFMEVRGRERVCVPCNCSSKGSTSTSCSADGKCNCLSNFGGKQCDQCSPGYYKYPECLPCYCDPSGSIGSTCDDNGNCHCKPNFDGNKCANCKEHFYNYPACEECNCDPRGVIASFAGCGSVPAGELCQCKNRVEGRICNDCKPLFWNLQEYNPLGCEECDCHRAGTVGGLGDCNIKTGQCSCKLHIGERQCDQCQDGFYSLEKNNIFGCTECDCDVGGSIDNNCDKVSGQCRCNSRVEGRRCDRPIRAHYFPTLHQFQYEVEEGSTPSGAVRYRYSDEVFPGYSWKGYVVFSILQNEVINIVHIAKPSLYRMVVKYSNPLKDNVVANIISTPESFDDNQQKFNVLLKPTTEPQLATVSGEKGNVPAPFVMNPGNWTITFKTTREIMIDYFVLIPDAYYEATVLTKHVDKPCTIGDDKLCRDFAYPSLVDFPTTDIRGLVTPAIRFITEPKQLKELKVGTADIPLLDTEQSELQYNLKIAPSGPYVLVVEYVTPVGGDAALSNQITDSTNGIFTLRFKSGQGPENTGVVNLDDCPYTSACRQVIQDEDSKIFIADVQDVDNVVYLDGESDTLVGIKSIVAIPEAKWHLDYITPRPFCLRRDGQCTPAVFPAAVDSKRVELENGAGGDRETRPSILDNSTVVVYLDELKPLSIESKVPASGEYMFVIHYYQPNNPETSINVQLSADGQQYEGSVLIEHCPSNSGCRGLLRLANGDERFIINENFTLNFMFNPNTGVWLDYVLVVATPDYKDSVLREANLYDYTREFINKCATNHSQIPTNNTGFCRDGVFSITADYNSGTLACLCNVDGSLDLECESYGGQCRCKPNVVGRTCGACRTGYYGFPDCKPCNCPSTAKCDDNGFCICPTNVEGQNCDRCKPFTFNFDVYSGCDNCNCHPLGVRGNQLQCNADNGNCDCKENVIGRMCDRCTAGNYGFPECDACYCSLAGTTSDICDQNTAQCYCKKHVTGQYCDVCNEEYFNLQDDNSEGCTKCHCFGKTTRCVSAQLYFAEITGMWDWYLVNIEANRTLSIFPHTQPPNLLNDTVIGADLNNGEANDKVVYFGAPNQFLGKRLTSYGGYLKYSIFYTSRVNGRAVSAADVIIGGPNGYIVHASIEQPPALTTWLHAVRLIEEEFTNLDGSPVTRDQFMNTLVNIKEIFIRATYWQEAVTTRLNSVGLDVGVEDWSEQGRRAESVEQCQCPLAYKGLSCEQCAEGHYRLSSGLHAGICVPCQCNGHTNTCDVNTGVCLECQDSTMGDHCELCVPGYHGDATVGTPKDCLICACPMPYTSNNFAIGCRLSDNGSLISCDCKPGYGGARCEFCSAGYYGNPEIIGDYCKPCNCSGNINVEDPGSCDSISGDCLKCVNNTAGQACNLCAPGFFGDAIFSKNCTACECDEYGMDHCDHATGTCVCRKGVLGDRCDQCQPDHWGLSSGQGCSPCECALASDSSQCDLTTGQCGCARGVTGLRCDNCAAGYWNYTKEGCDHCNCNTDYSVGFTCSATGQCQCLPEVIGEKCDRCPDRWVFIPEEGCKECDSCTDALLFSVEFMSNLLANETQDFKDKADTFFTTQRLNYISNQTQMLRPRVSEFRNVDANEITAEVDNIETEAKNLLRSAEFAATDSERQIDRAADIANDASKVLSAVREESSKATDTVRHVAELSNSLEQSQQPKVDSALSEARQIKNDIAEKNLDPKNQQAHNALTNATQQLERMNIFVEPVNIQNKDFEIIVNNTRELQNKLAEMIKFINLAQQTAAAAETVNVNNKASKFRNKVESVSNQNNAAMEDLRDAAITITNATAYHAISGAQATNTSQALEDIKNVKIDMENRISKLENDIPNLRSEADSAKEHVATMRDRADSISKLSNNNTRTKNAIDAANGYSTIVEKIASAKKSADDATAALENATITINSLKQRVQPTQQQSVEIRNRAASSLQKVSTGLQANLSRAEQALQEARATLAAADEWDNGRKVLLLTISAFSLDDEIQKSEKVIDAVKNTRDTMSKLGDNLTNSKVFAQSLPKIADDTTKITSNIQLLLNNMAENKPQIESTFKAVREKQSELENKRKIADEKIQKLRDLIEQARALSNRIPFGVTFDSKSTLQPRLPDTVDEMSTSTHVSAYFRTREKNGLILYLGNPKDTKLRRTYTDDFMVLEIQNGYPYLVMDIGDGPDSGMEPARIGSDKFVADDRWYQVVVDRIGRNVKLSIRESLENGSDTTYAKEAVLPGSDTIFNLDRQKSKLYVGGAPAEALSRLQGINYPAFVGQIEELMIGDTPVGLWNFENSENLKGARQRDKLITSQSGPQDYGFNGRGHVTIPSKRYLQSKNYHILLFFKTYATDGLIFLVGDEKHFFSIQMQDGRVFLQVSLGNTDNIVIIGTTKTYNDGNWHKLDAARVQRVFSLQLDNEPLNMMESTSDDDDYVPDMMNFGGNNQGIIQITNTGFYGCMRQISIDGVNIDLNENTESMGFANGCQFASLVSLSGEDSFLRFKDITTENLHLTLKFKTSKPDGLIFMYSSRTQTPSMQDSISLSLVKGKLKLLSQREEVVSGSYMYNDSQWHVVSVIHNDNELRLVVDDYEHFGSDTKPPPLHILDGVLFVGGLQPGYVVVGGRVGSRAPFAGCIADATLNNRVLNLLGPYNNGSVTFGRCGATTTTGGVSPDQMPWVVPERPDILPTAMVPIEVPETTQAPEIATVKANAGLQSGEVATPSTTLPPFVRPTPSTARPATTTRHPPPQPEGGCALAYDSQYILGNPDEGYRFGTTNDSRIEYGRLPGRQHDGFDLTITLRTFDEHGGLIFYAAAEKSLNQFLALYMKKGKLVLAFNCGVNTKTVTSEKSYTGTDWHTVTLVRYGGTGKLSVDNDLAGDETAACAAPAALAPPFYYGGLRDLTQDIKNNLGNFYQPFKGCLKGLLMNGQPVTDVLHRVNSLQCRDNVEDGIYFGPSTPGSSNYLKLKENFTVGYEISIQFEVKPRNSTGMLLSVHGKKDFLILELLENEVVANVENGKGPFHASFKLGNKYSLCDGKWHKIHAVKSRHLVSVGVDGHFSDAGMGVSGSTDTKSALFIGGHERHLSRVRGVRSRRGFSGCMRNIVIMEQALQIPLNSAHGNVHIGVCPAD